MQTKVTPNWLRRDSYQVEFARPNLKANFSKKTDRLEVTLAKNNSSLKFDLELAQATSAVSDSSTNPVVVYSAVNQEKVARYELLENGIKEEIILNSRPKTSTFEGTLSLQNAIYQDQAGLPVFALPDQQGVFRFLTPFAQDAAGDTTWAVKYKIVNPDEPQLSATPDHVSFDLLTTQTVALGQPKQNYRLIVEVDPDWLYSPERVYPIVIDPSVVHDTTSEFATGTFNRVQDVGSGSSPLLETYYQELTTDEHTIGLWHMNEGTADSCGSSNDVCDASANAHHGDFNGSAAFTTNAILGSSATTYAADTDYVSIADSDDFYLLNDYTVEAWINPDNIGDDWKAIAGTYNGSGFIFALQNNATNDLTFWSGGTWNYSGTEIKEDGTWKHVAYTRQGSVGIFYINGVEVKRVASATAGTNGGALHIGAGGTSWTTYRFDGLIDEVRISDVARTAQEIKNSATRSRYALYSSNTVDLGANATSFDSLSWEMTGQETGHGETASESASLVAQWNFNEASGTTANNDAEGTSCGGTPANCDLTLANFASTASRDALAGSGWTSDSKKWGDGALMFNGSDNNDAAYVADTNALDQTGDFTITTWVKPMRANYATDWQTILGKVATGGASANYIIHIPVSTDNYEFFVNNANPLVIVDAVRIGQWQFLAMVYDSAAGKLTAYIDGKLVGSISTGAPTNNANRLGFGAYYDNSNVAQDIFQGIIDVTALYARAMSPGELLSNYQAGLIELQTRTSADGSTWEDWKPTTGETQLLSLDNDESNWSNQTASAAGALIDIQGPIPSTPTAPTGCSNSKVVKIHNTGNWNTLLNHQVRLDLAYETGMNAAFTDLRFTDASGNDLDYYLDSYTASTEASVWIEVPNIPGGSSTYAFLWYNGCTGGNSSNGSDTFIFFDDFESYADTAAMTEAGWTDISINGAAATLDASNGEGSSQALKLNPAGGAGWKRAHAYYSSLSFGPGTVLDYWTDADATAGDNFYDGPQGFNNATVATGANYGSSGSNMVAVDGYTSSSTLDYFKTTASSTTTSTSLTGYVRSTAGEISIHWGSDGLARFYKDGVLLAENTTNIPTGAAYASFAYLPYGTVNGLAFFDNVKVRKYANPQPVAQLDPTDHVLETEGSGSLAFNTGRLLADEHTVGLWHLDETDGDGASTDLIDYSHYGNHGEIEGTALATAVVDGVQGNARDFDGANDYIEVAHDASVDPTAAWTIEAWVKRDELGVQHSIVEKYDYAASKGGYILRVDANNLFYAYILSGTSSQTCNSTTYLADGQWYHVAATFNASENRLRCYVNGKMEGNNTSATYDPPASTVTLKIGARGNDAGTKFDGSIDEVRISNIDRTNEEIQEAYRLGRDFYLSRTISAADLSSTDKLSFQVAADRPGSYLDFSLGEGTLGANTVESSGAIAAQWHLDESVGSGQYVKDSGPYSFDLDTNSTPITTQGVMGRGVYFNGGTYLRHADDTRLNTNGSSASWEFWIKTADTAAGIIDKYVDASPWPGYNISIVSSKIGFWPGGGSWIYSNRVITDNQWHHVVVVHSTTTASIYIDGTLDYTTSVTSRSSTGGDYLYLGYGPQGYLIGELDEVTMYNAALSAAQIRMRHELGLGMMRFPIKIEFGAKLDSGNLISNSTDINFTVDATAKGLTQKGQNLLVGDKIIVRENVGGQTYTAQGTTSSVNESTGAVTVSSWITGSSFPSGGFTSQADVFKWETQHFDLRGISSTSRDSVTKLVIKNTTNKAASFWLDDISSNTSYLATPGGSTITSTLNRYFQYRAFLTTTNDLVSPQLKSVSINYTVNYPPNLPTLDAPSDTATNQSTTPTLQTTATDDETNDLQYKIRLCTDQNMTYNCQTFDQTDPPQTGWSGQDVSGEYYASGTQASYTVQDALEEGTTYYWKSYATDPGGSTIWSETQATPYSFTTGNSPSAPTELLTNGLINPIDLTDSTPDFSAIFSDPNVGDTGEYYQIQLNTSDDFSGSVTWDSTQTAMTSTAIDVRSPDITYSGSALEYATTYYWRIRFWDDGGSAGAWSSAASFSLADMQQIQACRIAETTSDSSLTLLWSVTSGFAATHVYIEKNTDGGGFSSLTTEGIGASSYQDNSVDSEHTYQYRLRTTDGSNDGNWCTTATLNTATGDFSFEGVDFESVELN